MVLQYLVYDKSFNRRWRQFKENELVFLYLWKEGVSFLSFTIQEQVEVKQLQRKKKKNTFTGQMILHWKGKKSNKKSSSSFLWNRKKGKSLRKAKWLMLQLSKLLISYAKDWGS